MHSAHLPALMSMIPALLTSRDNSSNSFDTGPAADQDYGYVPTEAVAILFLALFGISTILHIGQAAWFKLWFLIPTAALCGLGELIGWSGRLWSAINPEARNAFLIQITCTIISPTPLLAASFIILGRTIPELGTAYSRLTPRLYTMVFLPCDIIALIVQGLGGGVASSAGVNNVAGANRGSRIMLGGIAFQFAVIIIFSVFGIDFFLHYVRDRRVRNDGSARGVLTPRLKLMLAALAFSALTLFIRSVYRIIELQGGWRGRIIRTQVYFNVLDGGMVVLAIFTLNFAHPGFLLRQFAPTKKGGVEMGGLRNSGDGQYAPRKGSIQLNTLEEPRNVEAKGQF